MLSFSPLKGFQWFISNHKIKFLLIHGLQNFLTLNLRRWTRSWVDETSKDPGGLCDRTATLLRAFRESNTYNREAESTWRIPPLPLKKKKKFRDGKLKPIYRYFHQSFPQHGLSCHSPPLSFPLLFALLPRGTPPFPWATLNSLSNNIKLGVFPSLGLLPTLLCGENFGITNEMYLVFCFKARKLLSCFSHVPHQSLTARLLSWVDFLPWQVCSSPAHRHRMLQRFHQTLTDIVWGATGPEPRWPMEN